MERGDLEEKDSERVELINSLVRDCKDGYCTHRMILARGKEKPVISPCSYGGNCFGGGWCDNREAIYGSDMKKFTLIQLKEVEKMQYLDSKKSCHEESWADAARHWTDPLRGANAVFRYAFQELHIENIGALERVCVHAAEDAEPILA